MTKEHQILSIQNRISVLEGRGKENGTIVKKLQRKLRIIKKE